MSQVAPAVLAPDLALHWRQAWAALTRESAEALPSLAEMAERAWARGDATGAATAAGTVLLAEHLQATRYQFAPRMLTLLAAGGPDRVASGVEGLPALAGAALAHDYGVLPSWPAADCALLRERAQAAPPDMALAMGCALGEICERNGLDTEFASLQAQLAAVAAAPEASPFWRGHWAIVCAWHLGSFGRWAAAREALQGAEALATAHGLAQLHANAALQRARLVESRLDPAAALALAEQMAAGVDPLAQPLRLADLADVRCRVALRRQDFHTAVSEARRAAGHTQASGAWPGYQATYGANEAYALLGTGAFDEAAACIDRLRETLTPRFLADRLLVLRDLVVLAAAERRGPWDANAQALLARVLRRLRELEWHAVLPALPELLASLLARALASGLEVDWVRAAIRFRGLRAPPEAPPNWPWPVMVWVLGDFHVETLSGPLHGEAAAPRKAAGKPLDLLRWLAAHGHAAAPVDEVAQALWPGDGREGRRKALETTLARLRRQLGLDDAVQLSDHRVRLNPQRVWVDVAALERHLGHADATAGAPPAFANAVDVAARLYRGPCLAGVGEEWALPLRDQVRARLAATLWRGSADGRLRAGPAWPAVLRLLAVDPALRPLLAGEGSAAD